jgi:hypothetical protein
MTASSITNLLLDLTVVAVIIFAGVAWLKQMGVKGQRLTLYAFIFGALIGVAYRYAANPMSTVADWILAVFFGLLAGFMATGAYKGGQSIVSSTPDKLP